VFGLAWMLGGILRIDCEPAQAQKAIADSWLPFATWWSRWLGILGGTCRGLRVSTIDGMDRRSETAKSS